MHSVLAWALMVLPPLQELLFNLTHQALLLAFVYLSMSSTLAPGSSSVTSCPLASLSCQDKGVGKHIPGKRKP